MGEVVIVCLRFSWKTRKVGYYLKTKPDQWGKKTSLLFEEGKEFVVSVINEHGNQTQHDPKDSFFFLDLLQVRTNITDYNINS